jgi:type IV pilus assembly protein PilE
LDWEFISMSLTKRTGVYHSAVRGFTLIELMIVIGILGVLAAIAFPNYMEHMMKSRRNEAKTLLMDIAARQEQYFLDNRSYTNNLANLRYSVNADGSVSSEKGSYTVTVDPLTFTATTYTLIAAAGPAQVGDPCGDLSLDSEGVHGRSGTGDKCW